MTAAPVLAAIFAKAALAQAAHAEEVDEDAFVERGVLIDQDADGFVFCSARRTARAASLLTISWLPERRRRSSTKAVDARDYRAAGS